VPKRQRHAAQRPKRTPGSARLSPAARSIRDLQDIVHELRERGVTLKAAEQPIDTRTRPGKAFLDMLGVFAEFETNLRGELEGIAAAKARGVYKGRKRSIDETSIRRLRSQGFGPPVSWGSAAPPSIGRWPGPMPEGGRKRIPGEALINLRRRLDMLPPRHPDRTMASPVLPSIGNSSTTSAPSRSGASIGASRRHRSWSATARSSPR